MANPILDEAGKPYPKPPNALRRLPSPVLGNRAGELARETQRVNNQVAANAKQANTTGAARVTPTAQATQTPTGRPLSGGQLMPAGAGGQPPAAGGGGKPPMVSSGGGALGPLRKLSSLNPTGFGVDVNAFGQAIERDMQKNAGVPESQLPARPDVGAMLGMNLPDGRSYAQGAADWVKEKLGVGQGEDVSIAPSGDRMGDADFYGEPTGSGRQPIEIPGVSADRPPTYYGNPDLVARLPGAQPIDTVSPRDAEQPIERAAPELNNIPEYGQGMAPAGREVKRIIEEESSSPGAPLPSAEESAQQPAGDRIGDTDFYRTITPDPNDPSRELYRADAGKGNYLEGYRPAGSGNGTFSTYSPPDYEAALKAVRARNETAQNLYGPRFPQRPQAIGNSPSWGDALKDYASGNVGSPGYRMIRNFVGSTTDLVDGREVPDITALSRLKTVKELAAAEGKGGNTNSGNSTDPLDMQRFLLDQQKFDWNRNKDTQEMAYKNAQYDLEKNKYLDEYYAPFEEEFSLTGVKNAPSDLSSRAVQLSQKYGIPPKQVQAIMQEEVNNMEQVGLWDKAADLGEGGAAKLMQNVEARLGGK